jgi:hypothetical protein
VIPGPTRCAAALENLSARSKELVDDVDHESDPGVNRIDQVVLTVDFVDVHVVGVAPIRGPHFVVLEPVTAVVEATIVTALGMEDVRSSEVGVKVFLADASYVTVAAVPLGIAGIVVLILLGTVRGHVRLLDAVFLHLLLLFGGLLALFFGVVIVIGLFLGVGFLLIELLILLVDGLLFLRLVLLLGGVLLLFFLLVILLRSSFLFFVRSFFGFLLFRFFLPCGFFLFFVLVGFLRVAKPACQQDDQCRTDCESHLFSLRLTNEAKCIPVL